MLARTPAFARAYFDTFVWPRLHAGSRGAHHSTSELPESRDVALIVPRLVDGRFKNESAFGEQRVIQNPAEGLQSDQSFSDVFVAVHARTERYLRIVHVNYGHSSEANCPVNVAQRDLQTFLGVDTPPSGERVRRVNTHAERQVRARVENRLQLLKPRAERTSLARGVFQQYPQIAELQSSRCLLNSKSNCRDGGFDAGAQPAARMNDQEVRAEGQGSYNFLMECLYRAGAQHRIWRGQIDQVVAVDHQGAELQFLSTVAEPRGIRLGDP